MGRLVQACKGCPPGIALVEQGLYTALQKLFAVGLMQAMNQPEFTAGWVLSESTLEVMQAYRAQSHPRHQH
ncbi:hypothetical protein [Pseudomonas sp. R3-18-08]|uniref:hypothetical protein n=1 Tax=Pseudomonas sp. R3-18-08 TaxID=1173283 RepID=UPI0013DDB8D6|nr:hypothetical protein [Pseudomonas sp. R3-18-08]